MLKEKKSKNRYCCVNGYIGKALTDKVAVSNLSLVRPFSNATVGNKMFVNIVYKKASLSEVSIGRQFMGSRLWVPDHCKGYENIVADTFSDSDNQVGSDLVTGEMRRVYKDSFKKDLEIIAGLQRQKEITLYKTEANNEQDTGLRTT